MSEQTNARQRVVFTLGAEQYALPINQVQEIGMTVDAVDEVLTVEADELEQIPGADTTLMDSIAKLGERLDVLLSPSAILTVNDALAA